MQKYIFYATNVVSRFLKNTQTVILNMFFMLKERKLVFFYARKS